jgi:YfiH family protein
VSEAGWRLEDVEGVRLVRCAAIEAVPGAAHAFSTRLAFGGARFDLGRADDATFDIRARRRAFLHAAGLGSAQPAMLRQVHGRDIVSTRAWPQAPPTADGVMRVVRDDPAGPMPAVGTADCVPVLMLDRNGVAVAALHAGWRGIAAGIGANAVARFGDERISAADVLVALGPAIGVCCYEVGEEVVEALDRACGNSRGHVERTPEGRTRVDLQGALRAQFVAAGVSDRSIHAAPWCTRCRTDLFFSYRAEGPATGRLMAVIGSPKGP